AATNTEDMRPWEPSGGCFVCRGGTERLRQGTPEAPSGGAVTIQEAARTEWSGMTRFGTAYLAGLTLGALWTSAATAQYLNVCIDPVAPLCAERPQAGAGALACDAELETFAAALDEYADCLV